MTSPSNTPPILDENTHEIWREALERIADEVCLAALNDIESQECWQQFPKAPEAWCPPCIASQALKGTER